VSFYDQGRLAEAQEQYELAIRENSQDGKAHFNLAIVHHDWFDFTGAPEHAQRAEELYRRACELLPNVPEPRINLAVLLDRLGRTQEAFGILEDAERIAPRDARIAVARGAVAERRDDTHEARRWYERALELAPDHPDALFRLGRMDCAAGEHERATARFERILAKNPDDLAALRGAGWCKMHSGAPPEAARFFERAAVIQPTDADTLDALARALEEAGDLEGAVATLLTLKSLLAGAGHASPSLDDVDARLRALYARLLEAPHPPR
jgi:tetratricopeptide (TPR) repeat protein